MAYTEQEARELVIKAGLLLMDKKLIARTWGNISARISDAEFIITPSGRAYGDLKPEELVKVKIDDLSYEGTIKPSSEKGIHAAVYAFRKDANFVIHTHQFYASALSAKEQDLSFAPCASYGLPGTKKLRIGVMNAITRNPEKNAFLMAKHGALAFGKTINLAFEEADSLEKNAKEEFFRVLGNMGGNIDLSEEGKNPVTGEPDFVKTFAGIYYTMPCYIDDFGQLIGPSVKLSPKAGFYRPYSAYSEEDAEAVEMIAQKNAAAGLYASYDKHIVAWDALLQRAVYVAKYSRLKNKNR